MTTFQMGLTIAVCTAATMLTRFLPFLIFSSKDHLTHPHSNNFTLYATPNSFYMLLSNLTFSRT